MKLYIGNLGDDGKITSSDLRPLFEQFGTVSECECIKNYAFVHMDDGEKASEAVSGLNGTMIKGRNIKVEKSESKGPRKPSTKLFVGNLAEGTTPAQLKELFTRYASVMEADIIKNFGFVHIDADAGRGKIDEILRELNGYSLNGNDIRVQKSTSGVRQQPGMGDRDNCYRCGSADHWSKECHLPDMRGMRGGGGGRGGGRDFGGRDGGGRGGGRMRGGGDRRGGDRGYGGGRGGRGNDRGYGGGGNYGGRDPYPPPPAPAYMRDRQNDGYGGGGYGNQGGGGGYNQGGGGGGYGGGGYGGGGNTDPYGRPQQGGYDDQRGGGGYGQQPPMGGGGPMRGPDPYGRNNGGGGGYGAPQGGYGGGNYGPPQGNAPAYSTQGGGGYGGPPPPNDMYQRRSPGPQGGYGGGPPPQGGHQGGYGGPPQGGYAPPPQQGGGGYRTGQWD